MYRSERLGASVRNAYASTGISAKASSGVFLVPTTRAREAALIGVGERRVRVAQDLPKFVPVWKPDSSAFLTPRVGRTGAEYI
jgi:hypothetical protein